jgi:hypothetical protein
VPFGVPLVLFGRYRPGAEPARLFLCGTVGEREIRLPFAGALAAAETDNAPVAALWARAAVAHLEGRLLDARGDGEQQVVRERIEDVALRNRLVTRFTSFVAEDRR